jgi:archaellin
MEIESEILVVIIASMASLIIGIININFNQKISSRQNKIELKKTKIDLFENRRQKLETYKFEISNRESEVQELNSMEDVGLLANYFSKNIKDVIVISHILNEEFVNKLKLSMSKLNQHSIDEKIGNKADYEKAFEEVKYMSKLNELIPIELEKKLFEIENKINRLIK